MWTSRGIGRCLFSLAILLLIVYQFILPIHASIPVASPQSNASLTEWAVPTPSSGPWALTLDQAGRCCWFAEYYGNKVAHLDPSTGTFQEWTIPTGNSNPYDLAVTSISGSTVVWGTEYAADRIFAFWPASGLFREYSLPHGNTGVGFLSIEPATSGQVRVWFTETTLNRNGEFIYDPISGNVTLYEDQFPDAAGGGAYGVYAAANSVWFAGFSAIVRWDRTSQQYTMWPLPVHGSAVGRMVTLDSQGQLWYTEGVSNGTSSMNFVGVLRSNSVFQEWMVPTLGADVRDISVSRVSQQPWIVERSAAVGNGAVAVLDNATGGSVVSAASTVAPSGGSPIVLGARPSTVTVSTTTVPEVSSGVAGSANGPFYEYTIGPSQPRDVVVDSAGNAWMSEPGVNRIARLSGFSSDYGLVASPSSLSLPYGGSSTVTVTGTSISGYAGPVTLGVSGVPGGVSLSMFNPPALNVPLGGNASSTLTINVTPKAVNGTSVITIYASNGTISHAASLLLTVSNSTSIAASKPQCLIATATYGSELSPEVEVLRSFRDSTLRSRAGYGFLLIFNAWYYSFSPAAANNINNNPPLRTAMKGILYPLIGFLSLASALHASLPAYPELSVILSGLLASSLIGAFYLGLPLAAMIRWLRIRKLSYRLCGVSLLTGLSGILLGEMVASPLVLMIAGSITILAAIFTSAILTANGIAHVTPETGQ